MFAVESMDITSLGSHLRSFLFNTLFVNVKFYETSSRKPKEVDERNK